MTPRLILTRAATAMFAAAAFSIALGHPPPQQPPEPGIATDPSHDQVSPLALATGIVVTCPPPTKTSAATNPTGSDC